MRSGLSTKRHARVARRQLGQRRARAVVAHAVGDDDLERPACRAACCASALAAKAPRCRSSLRQGTMMLTRGMARQGVGSGRARRGRHLVDQRRPGADLAGAAEDLAVAGDRRLRHAARAAPDRAAGAAWPAPAPARRRPARARRSPRSGSRAARSGSRRPRPARRAPAPRAARAACLRSATRARTPRPRGRAPRSGRSAAANSTLAAMPRVRARAASSAPSGPPPTMRSRASGSCRPHRLPGAAAAGRSPSAAAAGRPRARAAPPAGPASSACSDEVLRMTRVFGLSAANFGRSASVRLTTAPTCG